MLSTHLKVIARSLVLGAVPMALLLLAVRGGASAAEGGRVEIVDRAIEFHGGELYRHSDSSLQLCSRSGCYQISVRMDGGLFDYRVSGPYRERTRAVHWTNDSLSLRHDGEPMAVLSEAEQGVRDWAMARIYFAYLPFRLNDPSAIRRDLGLESWDGRELHKVKVGFLPGSSTDADDEYLYWFDPESGRLEQFAYSFSGNPGGLRFRRLGNYRRVGGILFSDQENLGVEGEGLTVDQITPAFVRERMRPVSEVTVSEITVRGLKP